jgi:hypothetical protein
MSRLFQRASSSKDKKKVPRQSESEDSDELIDELEAASKLKELKKLKKARKEEADAIERKIQEQDARNAARLKELAKKRNEYPVMLYMNCNALYIFP